MMESLILRSEDCKNNPSTTAGTRYRDGKRFLGEGTAPFLWDFSAVTSKSGLLHLIPTTSEVEERWKNYIFIELYLYICIYQSKEEQSRACRN